MTNEINHAAYMDISLLPSHSASPVQLHPLMSPLLSSSHQFCPPPLPSLPPLSPTLIYSDSDSLIVPRLPSLPMSDHQPMLIMDDINQLPPLPTNNNQYVHHIDNDDAGYDGGFGGDGIDADYHDDDDMDMNDQDDEDGDDIQLNVHADTNTQRAVAKRSRYNTI